MAALGTEAKAIAANSRFGFRGRPARSLPMPESIETYIASAKRAVELVRRRYIERCAAADARRPSGGFMFPAIEGKSLEECMEGASCPLPPSVTVSAAECNRAIDAALAGFTPVALDGLHASPLAFIPRLRKAFQKLRQSIEWKADWSAENFGDDVYSLMAEIVVDAGGSTKGKKMAARRGGRRPTVSNVTAAAQHLMRMQQMRNEGKTLEEIGRECGGVHKSTVSRALRDKAERPSGAILDTTTAERGKNPERRAAYQHAGMAKRALDRADDR